MEGLETRELTEFRKVQLIHDDDFDGSLSDDHMREFRKLSAAYELHFEERGV